MKKLFTVIMMLVAISATVYAQNNKLTFMRGPVHEVRSVTDDPSLLYGQMNINSGGWGIFNEIMPYISNCIVQGADDFTALVPWTINRVEIKGFNFSGPPSFFDVFIYIDNAGAVGTEVYHETGLAYSVDYDVYSIPLITPATLPAGHYFISIVPTGTDEGWFWFVQATPQIGDVFLWRDPCNAFGTGFMNWTPATVVWPDQNFYDLCFALYGEVAPPVPISNWALFIGIGLILAATVVRFRRLI